MIVRLDEQLVTRRLVAVPDTVPIRLAPIAGQPWIGVDELSTLLGLVPRLEESLIEAINESIV